MRNLFFPTAMFVCFLSSGVALGSENYPSSNFQSPSVSSPPPSAAPSRSFQTTTLPPTQGRSVSSPFESNRANGFGSAPQRGTVTPFQSQQSFSNSGEFFRSVGGDSAPQQDGWSSAIK